MQRSELFRPGRLPGQLLSPGKFGQVARVVLRGALRRIASKIPDQPDRALHEAIGVRALGHGGKGHGGRGRAARGRVLGHGGKGHGGERVLVGHTRTEGLRQSLSEYTPDDPTDLYQRGSVFALDTGSGSGGFLTPLELPAVRVYDSRDRQV